METDEQESNSPRKETFDKKVKAKLAVGPADKHMWNSVSFFHVLLCSKKLNKFSELYYQQSNPFPFMVTKLNF